MPIQQLPKEWHIELLSIKLLQIRKSLQIFILMEITIGHFIYLGKNIYLETTNFLNKTRTEIKREILWDI